MQHLPYSKVKKKPFSLYKFKKILGEDTALEFDERPAASIMTKETFDFFEVKEVTNCSELFEHSSQLGEVGEENESQSGSRIMRALGNFFTLQTGDQSTRN